MEKTWGPLVTDMIGRRVVWEDRPNKEAVVVAVWIDADPETNNKVFFLLEYEDGMFFEVWSSRTKGVPKHEEFP